VTAKIAAIADAGVKATDCIPDATAPCVPANESSSRSPTVARSTRPTSHNAMQFQADVLRIPVEVAAERETTAIGAAALAGLAVGVFTSKDEVARALGTAKRYEPQLDEDEAERLVREWRRAVKNALE